MGDSDSFMINYFRILLSNWLFIIIHIIYLIKTFQIWPSRYNRQTGECVHKASMWGRRRRRRRYMKLKTPVSERLNDIKEHLKIWCLTNDQHVIQIKFGSIQYTYAHTHKRRKKHCQRECGRKRVLCKSRHENNVQLFNLQMLVGKAFSDNKINEWAIDFNYSHTLAAYTANIMLQVFSIFQRRNLITTILCVSFTYKYTFTFLCTKYG